MRRRKGEEKSMGRSASRKEVLTTDYGDMRAKLQKLDAPFNASTRRRQQRFTVRETLQKSAKSRFLRL